MKHAFSLAVGVALAALLSVPSIALAVTPTTEPSLPADISTYESYENKCNKYPGKELVLTEYQKDTGDSFNVFRVLQLNGKKVYQAEFSQVSGSASKATFYVKTVSAKTGTSWTAYTQKEGAQALQHRNIEIGLTKEQFGACGR